MKKILIRLLLVGSYIVMQNACSAPLVWATEATYPPFVSMNSHGKMQGLDVDIAHAVCHFMKKKDPSLQCQFVNVPFAGLIPGLQVGKYDLVWGGVSKTKARSRVVMFSGIYYKNAVRFVAGKQVNWVLKPTGLKGKTIGVQQGNVAEAYLAKKYPDSVSIKSYASIQEAFMDLKIGRIDAVLSDAPVISVWLQKSNHWKQFAFKGPAVDAPGFFGKKNGNAIAVAKNNHALLLKINAALEKMKKSGQLKKIIQHWIGSGHVE